MMISCCRSSSILLVALLLPVVEGFRSASPLVSVGQQQQQQQQQYQHQQDRQRQRRSVVGPLFATGGNWNDLTTKLLTTPTNAGGGSATATTEGISTVIGTIQALLQQYIDKGQLVLQHLNELFVSIVSSLTSLIPSSNINFDTVSSIQPLLDQFKQAVVSIGILSNDDAMKVIQSINTAFSVLNTPESILVSAILSYVVINSVMTWSDSPPPGRPYPKGKYDPIAARIYFDSRPLQVLARSVTITVKSLSFALKLAQDKFIGGENTWQKNQEQRGLELAQLLTELGPTFIKSKSQYQINRNKIISTHTHNKKQSCTLMFQFPFLFLTQHVSFFVLFVSSFVFNLHTNQPPCKTKTQSVNHYQFVLISYHRPILRVCPPYKIMFLLLIQPPP
jgi:hypothetical protein